MKKAQLTYHKDKLTKWLLTATLLFGIFTLSGYAGNYQSRQQQTTQTELVISNDYKTIARSHSFKKAFETITCNDFVVSTYRSWAGRLYTYNILEKVRFDLISTQFCSYNTVHFLQIKTIPQSTDEEFLVYLIG